MAREAGAEAKPAKRANCNGVEGDRSPAQAARADYAQVSQAISNLRGVFILILIGFHACLAYLASTPANTAPFNAPPYVWLAYPIVDSRRFFGFDLYCAWEDAHVMAMMFLVSGLFAPASLRRKGAARFVGDRLARLAPPFVFNVLILMPLGIYPVYRALTPHAGLADYTAAYLALPFLPNGPTWFLWLLIAFSAVAAALYAAAPALYTRLGAAAPAARRNPKSFLAGLAAAAALAYLPLALAYGPFPWIERGPFSFQASRPLLYGVFYFAGAAIGAGGLERGLFAPDGVLVTRWRRLLVLSPAMLLLWMGLTGATLAWPSFAPFALNTASALAYVGASVSGVMCLIALSVRFCGRRIAWLEPLSRNSLGVFVLHYAPLVWMQYVLLDAPLPAVLKAALVFAATLALSLAAASAMRRSSALALLIGEPPSTIAAPEGVAQRQTP